MNFGKCMESYIFSGSFADMLTAVASLIAAATAWRGLDVWMRQLRGTASFEVARDMGLAIYGLRDALIVIRTSWPLVSVLEIKPQAIDIDDYIRKFQNFWPLVLKEINNLDIVTRRANVIWRDIEINKATDSLKKIASNVQVAHIIFIEEIKNENRSFMNDEAMKVDVINHLRSSFRLDQPNIIDKSINRAIKEIEEIIDSKLLACTRS